MLKKYLHRLSEESICFFIRVGNKKSAHIKFRKIIDTFNFCAIDRQCVSIIGVKDQIDPNFNKYTLNYEMI